MASDLERSKVIQIFEYLLAVKNLNEKIIRNINEYERVWWINELPHFEGCYLNGSGENIDAWLEVHKQDIPPAPALPQGLSKWIKKWNNPAKEPEKVLQISKGYDKGKNEEVLEKFEDDEERVNTYNEWYENKWKPWANEALPKFQIQKLYMELFELHQRLQREGDDLEIGCGHGLLVWKINDEFVYRHLLVTKMELQFNAKKGVFYLIPTSKGTQLETDMLTNINIPNASRLQEMESEISDLDLSPWDEELIEPVFREIAHTISPKGSYKKGLTPEKMQEKPHNPVVFYMPAFFLRKIGGRLWQKELSTAIEKIKNGYPVPETITTLTSTSEEKKEQRHESFNNSEWKSVGEDLLFPLPANNEQKLIARKLALNEGVVVQGPPGTGKSHTIANLICHLLAHGKRVLVTSEKERALQVLRDKIPEEIRSLCVSVLGGDSRSVKEIEDSIKSIAENLDTKQIEVLNKNIERLKEELHQTKRNIAKINTMINKAAEIENEKKNINGVEFTPLEAARWLKENEDYSWLPDNIDPSIPYPLTTTETMQFFQLLGEIQTEDRISLSQHRVKTEELVDPVTFEKHVQAIQLVESKMVETEKYLEGWNVTNELTFHLDDILHLTKTTLNHLEEISKEKWLKIILKEIITQPDKKQFWEEFASECKERINNVNRLTNDLIEDEIVIPSNANHSLLKEDLHFIQERMKNNKSIGWFFQKVTGRKYAYIFEQCKINGLSIRNSDDVTKLLKYLEREELIKKLVLKWNRIMDENDGPKINADQKRFTSEVSELLNQLKMILNWDKNVVEKFNEVLKEIKINEEPKWNSIDWFIKLQNGFSALNDKICWEKENEFFDKILTFLQKQQSIFNAHESVEKLYEACKTRDVQLWKEVYNDLLRLEALEEPYKQFNFLKKKLEEAAPRWCESLLSLGGKGEPLFPPDDIDKAWMWSQVNTWLKEIHSKPKMEDLEQELQREKEKESRLIKELVAESTWKSQIERTTKEQKRSLFAWLKAIQRIGKGTGKYVNVYRKEASKEMKIARGAIPVWIMPIQRVIENIELTNDLFDVVIVDESSQSNLFSLSVLLRGKKAVIVGDDNQISPESVGTDISEVHDLIERHLYNIPNKLQFEMKTSLYDTASRVFDSKIILKEHFRCVPEIIQFSNDLMYGGMIDPLRSPLRSELLEPPVKAIRVEDGYRREDTRKVINEPEAVAIVNHIAECCRDEKYKGKTIGVISLQGHDQAKLIENLLREKIGEEEMINRKIICGDSYSFQGDERDVIFLSMVVAPNMRIGPMTKRSDYQRFNVAASRARDQMFLYHSVDLKHLNPECVRYRLLQYCLEPHRVQLEVNKVKEVFDSKFEEDVYRMIVAKGYRVIPQVKVGSVGKRIDLVVEGMRSRLAVECDGDQWHGLDKWEDDIERQRVLERVGWTFWRVRGSQFYLDPEKAMSSLWEKLDEMGIYPIAPKENADIHILN
ncbi:AAA domain-containing protein [Parageobacillus thermoglucosidasius]|uniref:AAA domain-containing protein n=1 Tax=Parageobacillus thermoglucosidasius TaxID=1426 RepID=UPI003D275512